VRKQSPPIRRAPSSLVILPHVDADVEGAAFAVAEGHGAVDGDDVLGGLKPRGHLVSGDVCSLEDGGVDRCHGEVKDHGHDDSRHGEDDHVDIRFHAPSSLVRTPARPLSPLEKAQVRVKSEMAMSA